MIKIKKGLDLITLERREQIEKHGFSLKNDQYYNKGQLFQAAIFCLHPYSFKTTWPEGWDIYFMKKIFTKTKIQRLVVAGAFLLAENDRLNSDFYTKTIYRITDQIDKLLIKKP